VEAGSSRAAGERSVSVGGDVVGSLIVTGDNNNVNLVLGSAHGALLEQLSRASRPAKRLRAAPLRSVPARLPDSVDRESEARTIVEAVAAGRPVNVHGPRGIGKTHAVLRALNTDDPVLHGSSVYLYAPGPLDDVLQLLFETWYECEPPYKPSTAQLRRDLATIDGVVALDSVVLEREAAQQLLLDAAGCRIVVCSRQRVLSDGAAVALHGLQTADALLVLAQELGRPLAPDEREPAERICAALAGHPLKIREAVASATDAGRSLPELAAALSVSDPDAALADAKFTAAGPEGDRLLAALAVFGDATIGKEHLRAIAGEENFDELLMAALRRRDIAARSPRYNLGATLTADAKKLDVAPAGRRALAHFADWAHRNRAEPAVLITEAAALVALLRWAVNSGYTREAIALGREIDHAFALERRFGAWGQVLDLVHAAALTAGDRDAEGWALHQLGTRALCLGELAAGASILGQAMELRRRLGDERGASYTARNLSLASRPRWYTRWILGHSMLVVGLLIALFAAGVVAAATLPGGGHSQNQNQTFTTSSPSTSTGPPPTQSTATPSTTQSTQSTQTTQTTTPGGGTTTKTTIETLTISLGGSGQGQVTVMPGGKVCPGDCTQQFNASSVVTLSETATQGSLFTGFSGCAASGSSCRVVMDGDQHAIATFEPAASVFVEPDPHLTITSQPTGIECPGAACRGVFPLHATVVLTADQPAYWTAPGCAHGASATGPTAAATPPPPGSESCTITLGSPESKVGVSLPPSTATTTTTTTTAPP
jgi:hypothetical protein